MAKKRIVVLSLIIAFIFTLIPAIPAEAAMKMSKKSVSIMAGETLKLKVSGTKKDIKWSSSKKSVATVSKNGKVKGKKPGTAVITAKAGKKSVKCKVKVTKKFSINDYVKDGVFDYVGYGASKGATEAKLNPDGQQIGFFFSDGWFVEVSTSISTEVTNTGVAYIGVGRTSDYDLPYVAGISPSNDDVIVSNNITIPRSSLNLIDALINYMLAHPDPNQKPSISGVNFVTWEELYP